jgi:hypothetical protein
MCTQFCLVSINQFVFLAWGLFLFSAYNDYIGTHFILFILVNAWTRAGLILVSTLKLSLVVQPLTFYEEKPWEGLTWP